MASDNQKRSKPAMELTGNSRDYVKSFMADIDAVLFDCDGVLWLGNDPLENAAELVILLRSMGKRVFFMTNNSMKTREEFLEKFNGLGFQAKEEEIISTGYLTALYLKKLNFKRKAYVIGLSGLTQELTNVGIECLSIGADTVPIDNSLWAAKDFQNVELDPAVGAVVVGFDHHFSYMKALKAASYLNVKNSFEEDCLFIATNTDEQFPARGDKKLTFPGAGTYVAAVKTCSGQEPVVMGKPEVFPFELIQKQFGLDPKRVLMVGDRGNTDILFGRRCGIWTLLVMTGVTTENQLHGWEQSEKLEEQQCVPDYYTKDVNQFYKLLSGR